MALAGAFLKKSQFNDEKKYPLKLYFCNKCFAVQVDDNVPPEILFQKNYFYFSSKIETLSNHFKEYACQVLEYLPDPNLASVLEFGCNDGVLLIPLADQNIKTVIGVDPASNVISTINDSRVTVINDFFNQKVAQNVIQQFGKIDLVVANNVFAHISDIFGITKAIENVLSINGVFIFEIHYLESVLSELQFDMVYHEHKYYYSLISLQKHFANFDMVIFDYKKIPIHAGSIRFFVSKKNGCFSAISNKVKQLEAKEIMEGYDNFRVFKDFSKQVWSFRTSFLKWLNKMKSSNKRLVGYGASGRANTVLQFCSINDTILDYMVDDSPEKIGFYTPGSHLKIMSRKNLLDDMPDYVIVFAWSFFEEICNKNSDYINKGGRFVLPFPYRRIYPA
jgi:SAM-dependent methyltransferase